MEQAGAMGTGAVGTQAGAMETSSGNFWAVVGARAVGTGAVVTGKLELELWELVSAFETKSVGTGVDGNTQGDQEPWEPGN
jgi:hypothetical protein